MLLNQFATTFKQNCNVAKIVHLTFCTKDRSPCTIRKSTCASDPLELGCLDYEAILARRLASHLVVVEQQFEHTIGGRKLQFIVDRINETRTPEPFLIQRGLTRISITEMSNDDHAGPCGGMDKLIHGLANVIHGSTNKMLSAFQILNIPITKSILLHGVPGVGKATVVKNIARHLGYALYSYHIRDLVASFDQLDDPGFKDFSSLRLIFERARANQSSILMVQGLDLLQIDSKVDASIRNSIISLLRNLVQSIQPEEQVFVIGLAKGLKLLPEPLKTLDIFGQREHVPIPTRPQRQFIMKALIEYYKIDFDITNSVEDIVSRISQRTSGYVAKDLKVLLRTAVLHAMRKSKSHASSHDLSSALDALSLNEKQNHRYPSYLRPSVVTWKDLEYALENSSPSQQAGFETAIDKRTWADIGGYTALKTKLQRAVLLPISNPETYAKLGIPPPSGVLLYGPSGCGKSLLVQALASESTMNVIHVKGPEIFSKYLGETEAVMRNLFATAKRVSPCIVFIDEMDSIACKRGWDAGEGGNSVNERLLSTLLNEMDGVEGRQGVFVIGCTNSPDQIDDAILRPGRLDLLLHVDLPKKEDRKEIVLKIMSRMAIAKEVDAESIAQATKYCTGADLNSIFREAAKHAIQEDANIPYIHQRHIDLAISRTQKKAEKYALDGSLKIFEKFSDRGMK